MATDPAITAHQTWLGYVQPVGLVVSPPALVAAQCALPLDAAARQAALQALVPDGRVSDLVAFLRAVLEWQAADLIAGSTLPDLQVPLPEYGDILAPTWAIPKADGEAGFQLLVVQVDGDLDAMPPESASGWRASAQARIERLLREREIPVGLLCNATDLRLVYAPRGESSGYLTFRLADMLKVPGRPILGALIMLLHADRLFTVPPNKRLPAVLKESRKYQAQVSNALAEQVLGALDDLLRGFEMADADRKGALLRQVVDTDPQHVYGGLITVLLRLVFLLYAEERALMSGDPVYVRHYSIAGLFEKLREDAGRHPDTMDQRYGAWARLLSLFRFVWEGGGDDGLHLPGRRGSLFDPGIYAFLEGREYRQVNVGERIEVPRVPDGVVWRVLEKLLLLDGERLSYRALDVEQIGSVYEAMMGFELRRAYAPSVALRPKRVVVSVVGLLLQASGALRAKILDEEAQVKVTGKALDGLKAAKTVEEVVAALGKKVVDGRVLPEGSLYLQPGEERRRSGSHYTPRSLTEPIVRTTLRPVLEALGARPRPEQILALKVCDPAMGSGAFLVEACRQLADALVEAWSMHRCTPEIPADEDPVLYARRLVAQRCLYGVDKNPFAVNLAKLSLWLVTLAKDHPFTFLDHALKHGDSLVGLTKRQIGRFDWTADDTETPPLLAAIEAATASARGHRDEIHRSSDDDDARKRLAWKEAEDDLDPARLVGDLCIDAFFGANDANQREERRASHRALLTHARGGNAEALVTVEHLRDALRNGELPVVPLHWELEFPEVFGRTNGGFDAIIGNPPFLGGTRVSANMGSTYLYFMIDQMEGTSGNVDLAAFFVRRCDSLVRIGGAFGLITTNSVKSGDSGRASLALLLASGRKRLCDESQEHAWPGTSANVTYIQIAMMKAQHALRKSPQPHPLLANRDTCVRGCDIFGEGFLLAAAEATELASISPAEAEVVKPYMGGAEFNESPTQSNHRYIIDFGDMTESEARAYPLAFSRVETLVRPARARVSQRDRRELWWLFATRAPRLRLYLAANGRVLVTPQVSKHLSFGFVNRDVVVGNTLTVVLAHTFASFASLQSRIHEAWARRYGSALQDRPRYTPSDCFETFPFQPDWRSSPVLEVAGRDYFELRASHMIRNGEGLTDTYNRFHDPDERDPGILRLRELHAAIDRAVLDAYGWTDLQPVCEFLLPGEESEDNEEGASGKRSRKKKPWRYRWPDDVRDEVLARLLALNQQRAEEERKVASSKDGAKPRKPAKPKKPVPKPPRERVPAPSADLFADGPARTSADGQPAPKGTR